MIFCQSYEDFWRSTQRGRWVGPCPTPAGSSTAWPVMHETATHQAAVAYAFTSCSIGISVTSKKRFHGSLILIIVLLHPERRSSLWDGILIALVWGYPPQVTSSNKADRWFLSFRFSSGCLVAVIYVIQDNAQYQSHAITEWHDTSDNLNKLDISSTIMWLKAKLCFQISVITKRSSQYQRPMLVYIWVLKL